MAKKVTPEGAKVMQVVAVPVPTASDYKFRKMLNRKNKKSIEILHEIPKASKVEGCYQKCHKKCCPCCYWCKKCDDCFCKNAREMRKESSYVFIMENRMEFNWPHLVPEAGLCSVLLCRYRVNDRIFVGYFDSDMYDHVKTSNPFCYSLTTWCCGSTGETIKFKRRCPCCPTPKLCGITVVRLKVTDGTAQKVTVLINEARDNARAKMAADE